LAVLSGAEPLLRVAAFRPRRAGLVQSTLSGTKASVLDKTTANVRARLERLESTLACDLRCAHEAAAIRAAIASCVAEDCELIMISGASAITDRRDVVPESIVQAGGTIEHFGMPVDPGNLMLVARAGKRTYLGLPGCARSPKLNGFDWVLERVLADLPVGRRELTSMGAGGLLMDVDERPLPRARATLAAGTPRIGAVILAAGMSRRMGKQNKMLAAVGEQTMIAHVADQVLASRARPIVVVCGHEAAAVKAALGERPLTCIDNPDYAAGLSTSLAAGLAALPTDLDGVVVVLGDMPRVGAAHIDRLIAAFNPLEGRHICVPTAHGKRGNPVLWARAFIGEMMRLKGDAGAKALMGQHADLVAEVAFEDDAVLRDVDTPQALAEVTA
jgi:molybdenum cofactor cytidylyltransferase